MKGLYKGKYLIVYYDKDEFPIIVASSSVEFEELYRKFINPNIQKRSMVQILSRISMGVITRSNIKLVEADTVVDDCFKEADIDFINFVYIDDKSWSAGEFIADELDSESLSGLNRR